MAYVPSTLCPAFNYTSISLIGTGVEGTVFAAKLSTGRTVAVKVYKEDAFRKMKIVCNILERIRIGHRNNPGCAIVEVIQTPTIDNNMALIMESCPCGDLSQYIERTGESTEVFVWHVYNQLANAIDFLHNEYGTEWKPIVHCDIRPENILLAENPRNPKGLPLIKVTDFHFAQEYSCEGQGEPIQEYGTPDFSPPETWDAVRLGPVLDPSADVWAVGVVVYWLCKEGLSPGEYWKEKKDEWVIMPDNEKTLAQIRSDVWNKPMKLRRLLFPITQSTSGGPIYSMELQDCLDLALQPLESRMDSAGLKVVLAAEVHGMQAEMQNWNRWVPPPIEDESRKRKRDSGVVLEEAEDIQKLAKRQQPSYDSDSESEEEQEWAEMDEGG